MDEQNEYSVAKEITIVSSIGFFLGVLILVVGLLIVEYLKG
jgi:uncharacterized membrane protein YiaA